MMLGCLARKGKRCSLPAGILREVSERLRSVLIKLFVFAVGHGCTPEPEPASIIELSSIGSDVFGPE
jgi:hypothetical protein